MFRFVIRFVVTLSNYIFLLSLLAFGFINIFFYRISEHGTDRSALIVLFLIVIEIISVITIIIAIITIICVIYILIVM